MLLKNLTQRYNLQDERRWSVESRDLMICSLALDPRFKNFAVQLCGLSRGEAYVWGVVKDSAIRHKRYERVASESEEVVQPSPKRVKSGFFSAFEAFVNEGPPASSSQHSSSESNSIDVAIETYRQMPVLSQDADPLRFWETNSAATVLQPLLPLAASVAAVPATEAICERLFKTGGQVLTSARLRLLGSRVESIMMTNFNLQLSDAPGV